MKNIQYNFYDGYFTLSVKSDKKLKLRVNTSKYSITYDINNQGELETLPLQFGNDKYIFTLYQQLIGKQYIKKDKLVKNIELMDQESPYLNFSQQVPYIKNIVEFVQNLCKDCNNEKDKYLKIKDYMRTHFTYDYLEAALKQTKDTSIQSVWTTHRGTCLNLSVITAIMLRAIHIPTRLIIGYADKTYHAWNAAKIADKWYRLDISSLITSNKKNINYTIERWY